MAARSRARRGGGRGWIQAAVVAAGSLPAAALVARGATGGLGANPVETITHSSGSWGLRLLLASLAVTPARRLLGWSGLAPYRRTLGLLAFGYGSLHVLTWLTLEHFFAWTAIAEDIVERPFVTAGAAAFACLIPLAVTSTRRWKRRLGRRWVHLHRLVYVAAAAAVVHFAWGVKADLREPLLCAAVLAGLLALRLVRRPRGRAPG